MPGTALCTGDALVSQTDKSPTLQRFVSKKNEMDYKLKDNELCFFKERCIFAGNRKKQW